MVIDLSGTIMAVTLFVTIVGHFIRMEVKQKFLESNQKLILEQLKKLNGTVADLTVWRVEHTANHKVQK